MKSSIKNMFIALNLKSFIGDTVKHLIYIVLILFSCSISFAKNTDENRISGFIMSIADGQSEFFIDNGVQRDGHLINSYQLIEINAKDGLIQAKVEFEVIGEYEFNEINKAPKIHNFKKKIMYQVFKFQKMSNGMLKFENSREITPFMLIEKI